MLIFRGCRYFFLHGPKLVLYQSFWLTYMHSVYPSDRPRKWVLTCYTTTFWGLCWPAISHVQLNNKMMTTNWTNLVLFHYSRRITTLWYPNMASWRIYHSRWLRIVFISSNFLEESAGRNPKFLCGLKSQMFWDTPKKFTCHGETYSSKFLWSEMTKEVDYSYPCLKRQNIAPEN